MEAGNNGATSSREVEVAVKAERRRFHGGIQTEGFAGSG